MPHHNHPFEFIQDRFRKGYRQKHACTCGPSSLALAAASLGLPLHAESAWLNETYSRWVPVAEFIKRGMALHEAQIVTELVFKGELEVLLRRAFQENLGLFQNDLKRASEETHETIVLNFAQDHLTGRLFEDQGSPHYSPVAGYDSTRNEVLIADVDSETIEPYTVPVTQAFEGMAFTNPALGLPRGWLILRRRRDEASAEL